MVVDVRKGFHGDICYVFEDAGFNTTPNDTDFKGFGSNVTMDTFEASRQAARKYNASRTAAEIIGQNFDGGWSVTFELGGEPAWWLAGIYGDPSSSNTTNNQYEHTYDLDNNNDPRSFRIYAPTDGFSNYYVIPGCWLVSASIDQSQDGSPEVTLTGGYASEPFEDTGAAPSVPAISDATFSNRDAEVKIDSSTVGAAPVSSKGSLA